MRPAPSPPSTWIRHDTEPHTARRIPRRGASLGISSASGPDCALFSTRTRHRRKTMRSGQCAAPFLVLAFVLPVAANADPSLSLRLFTATYQDDAATITALLGAGADPNVKVKHGITPLHIAAKWGHTSAIDSLLAGGANPNAKKDRDDYLLVADGGTPLHVAAYHGHDRAIVSLLAGGADPNAKTSMGPILWTDAAFSGNLASIDALLAAGADPNMRSKYGGTPLHQAAVKGHLSVIDALLAAGANPNAKNGDGKLPWKTSSPPSRTSSRPQRALPRTGTGGYETRYRTKHLVPV